jgi:hypothetical protein
MNTPEHGLHLGVVHIRQGVREDDAERILDVPVERREDDCDCPWGHGLSEFDGVQHDRAGQSVRFDRPSAALKMADSHDHGRRGEHIDLRGQDGSSFFKVRMNGIRRSTPSIIPGFNMTAERQLHLPADDNYIAPSLEA